MDKRVISLIDSTHYRITFLKEYRVLEERDEGYLIRTDEGELNRVPADLFLKVHSNTALNLQVTEENERDVRIDCKGSTLHLDMEVDGDSRMFEMIVLGAVDLEYCIKAHRTSECKSIH